jgi:D-alanyl-D-alanine carboxypeptidase (penicillin-binding protein 5/6)
MSIHEPPVRPGPAHYSRPTLVHPRRRRWVRIAAVAAVLVTVVAALLTVVVDRVSAWRHPADQHTYLGADAWPSTGQAAFRLNDEHSEAGPGEQPVSIASVAKVMTAYVVLHEHPLADGAEGPTITVTDADVADTQLRRSRDESVVDVAAGEQLTERQALEALLIPSANNVAHLLAIWSAGSLPAFVDQMNATARHLNMTHTSYTDPSGYDAATSSTAADQVKLATAAIDVPVINEIVAMRQATLPVAGTVRSTDTLLGKDGFVGMKTGSTDSAGGCFMFHVVRTIGGRRYDLVGVVLGQPGQRGRPLYEAGLNAARQLADRILLHS